MYDRSTYMTFDVLERHIKGGNSYVEIPINYSEVLKIQNEKGK